MVDSAHTHIVIGSTPFVIQPLHLLEIHASGIGCNALHPLGRTKGQSLNKIGVEFLLRCNHTVIENMVGSNGISTKRSGTKNGRQQSSQLFFHFNLW